MLCQFLLYNKVNQPYVYIYPISPPSCASLPPSLSHPSRWSQSTELTSLCYVAASHQLTILHYIGSIYASMLLSLCPSFPLPQPMSSSPFCMSADLDIFEEYRPVGYLCYYCSCLVWFGNNSDGSGQAYLFLFYVHLLPGWEQMNIKCRPDVGQKGKGN